MLKVYRKISNQSNENFVEAEQLDHNEKTENILKRYPELTFVRIGIVPLQDVPYEIFKLLFINKIVKKGTWFITNNNGKHWIISDDEFKKTYEEVE